ncbi:ATP-binding cassette domain-containing protein [Nocardiopsis dassonvillei]
METLSPPASDTTSVRAEGLRKSYGDVTVLDGVDLEVPRGGVLALLGPNGAGKTTLVNILTTLIRPDVGTATVLGLDVVRQARLVRRRISVTGQQATVDEELTARENLVMIARLLGSGRGAAADRAADLLERFGLTGAADRRTAEFSGGMRRRLDLAASLVGEPAVVFLDEPTTGMDTRSRQALWEAVRELAAAGTSVLLTTQYLEEADVLADRVAVIDHGRITASGTAAELKGRVGGEWIELTLADGRVERVPGDGTADRLREVLVGRHRDGVRVADVRVHRPTMDDVFLALTGKGGER